jgi:predicted permease
MTVVLGTVLPVFGLMLTGYVFARTRTIDAAGARGLSVFVFNVAIPALLFRSLAGESRGAGLGIVYAYFGGCLIVFALAMLVARLRFRHPLQLQSLVAINATFSNSVQLGIPIVFTAFGPDGAHPLLLVIAFHTVTLITLATTLVEIGLGKGKGALRSAISVLRALAGNPLLLAIAAGWVWSLARLPMPGPLDEFLKLLGAAGSPCALFVLGASLATLRLAGALAETLTVAALKLFVLPLVVYGLSRFVFDLTPIEIAVATVTAALPSGANAFILAQRYELYVARSASIVLVTTVLSVVTVSLCLAAFADAR